jgi:hypothetical protein
MKWPAIGTLVLLGTVLGPQGSAWAQPQIRPELFALAPADFPQGSHMVRAGVESNQLLLRDQVFRFGPHPRRLGRLTGYYMEALESPGGSGLQVSTSYLVSIFTSRRQALFAWEMQYSSWFAENYFTAPPPIDIPLGERGAQALFSTHTSAMSTMSELFFQRGAILVEIFQEVDGTPGASQTGPIYAIAKKLSALARLHPKGS